MAKTNEKKKDFFWLSYSDLMTSLFFVMLVLFVLVYSMQSSIIKDLTAAKEELDRIKEIEKAVNNIDKRYFTYDNINKKHILNIQFLYPTGSSQIHQIVPDKRNELVEAGRAIKNLILKFPEKENIKYLIVVEGQASKDDWTGNDQLSFNRAQSLIKFWEAHEIGGNNGETDPPKTVQSDPPVTVHTDPPVTAQSDPPKEVRI